MGSRSTQKPEAAAHWSFQPVTSAPVPQGDAAWGRNPIDAFLSEAHRKRGLVPVGEAAPNVLLRRVHMDLVGVPPTTEELAEFLSDPSDDRYLAVVDRLLANPRHGERWGRHWMDVWRYSDWAGHGAEVRESQPHIWRWRDWIVESVNGDKPYDRMVVEMLAADEAAPRDPEALRATGFLVRNWFRYNRNVWLEATVEHTGKAFLGLTLNCARCHSHKFDPIPQEEYYRVRAVFDGVKHGERSILSAAEAKAREERKAALERDLAAAQAVAARWEAEGGRRAAARRQLEIGRAHV